MTLFPRDERPAKRNLGNVGGVACHPNTAHIPGGGPKTETCIDCVHFIPTSKRRNGRCFLAAQMRGLAYRFTSAFRKAHPKEWWRGIRAVADTTPACKYWSFRK